MTSDGQNSAPAVLVEGGDAVTTSAPPSVDPAPERVDVSCDSWEQFENAFRRQLDSHRVFVPSVQPPPPGTQLEFRFSIPDGTSISMPGRVISTVPPPAASQPSSAERAGMIVEFGKFARAEEKRVRALLESLEQQDGPSSLAPSPPLRAPSTPSGAPSTPPASRAVSSIPGVPASAPARAPSSPSRAPSTPSAGPSSPGGPGFDPESVLKRLRADVALLKLADELQVLGVDRGVGDPELRAAYLKTAKRYHPQAFARYDSPELRELATEAYALVQRAYAQLSNAPRMPDPDPGAPRSQRPIRHQQDVAVREAVRLMELRQYPDAIRMLVEVLNSDPDNAGARLWLNLAGARHARELGQDGIAADCYREVLALRPGHPEARQQLAILTAPRPSAPVRPRGKVIARLTKKRKRG